MKFQSLLEDCSSEDADYASLAAYELGQTIVAEGSVADLRFVIEQLESIPRHRASLTAASLAFASAVLPALPGNPLLRQSESLEIKFAEFWTEDYLIRLNDRRLLEDIGPTLIREPRSLRFLEQNYPELWRKVATKIYLEAADHAQTLLILAGHEDWLDDMDGEEGSGIEQWLHLYFKEKVDKSLPLSVPLGLVLCHQWIHSSYELAEITGGRKGALDQAGKKIAAIPEQSMEKLRAEFKLALILGQNPSLSRAAFYQKYPDEELLERTPASRIGFYRQL